MAKLEKVQLSGWNFEVDCNRTLPGVILRNLDAPSESSGIRKKNNRAIFRLHFEGRNYFIKYNYPLNIYHKVKDFFLPKAESEYRSWELLKAAGIPTINMSGFGSRGAESILITEDAGEGCLNAIEFWKMHEFDLPVRAKFLEVLASFILGYNRAGLFHPDFHMGNILVKCESDILSLILIDPYGIRRSLSSDAYHNGTNFIISSIFNRLTRSERISFFSSCGIITRIDEYPEALKKIIENINDKWHKRRQKVLSGKTRFSTAFLLNNGSDCHVRINPYTKALLLEKSTIETRNFDNYDVLELDKSVAEARWLFSFYLDCRSVNHIKPLAWLKNSNGKDMLVCEMKPAQDFNYTREEVEDFIRICTLNRIKNISESELIFSKNIFFLPDSDPHKYGFSSI